MKSFGKLTVFSFACLALGTAAFAGPVLLNQLPDQSNGLFSDSGCDICGTGQQSIAVPFAAPAASSVVGSVKFWGGYFPSDTAVADSFVFRINADDVGIPGANVSNEPKGVSRALTGVTLFGVSEYEYGANITDVAVPGPAFFWMEIYNATGIGDGDQWFWEAHGSPNPDTGGTFSAFAFETPGAAWNQDADTSLACVIREADELLVTMESFTGELNRDGTVALNWTTASESDNAGFKVVRVVYSRDKAARYQTLTPQLIPAKGNTLEGADYQFVDVTAPAGRVGYLLFDVDNNGRETQHGPVLVETRTITTLDSIRVKPTGRTR
jgi:hypothetical protein